MKADLHVHTHYSDGVLSPERVVCLAKAGGVDLLAVTDHDTAMGIPEVRSFCEKAGIKLVNGIEISAYSDGIKVHTLGYAFDENNSDFLQFTSSLQKNSIARAEDIIYKLNSAGVRLKIEDAAAERANDKTPIHVMHIARAGARKGYANNPFTFHSQYLAAGKRAYSEILRPAPELAVEVIRAAGGVTSVAHPARITLPAVQTKKLITRLAGCGLGGIEAVYSAHTNAETAYYKELAKELGLFISGGSDTHAEGANRKVGTPDYRPDKTLLQIFGIET